MSGGGNNNRFTSDIEYILLDYYRLLLINNYFTEDTIEYNGEIYKGL